MGEMPSLLDLVDIEARAMNPRVSSGPFLVSRTGDVG